jgi:hypothetical protein
MDQEIIFSESQKFKQWWLWLILLGLNVLFIFGYLQQVLTGKQFGDRPMSNNGLLAITVLTVMLSLLFYFLRLDTQIKKDGVYVRFSPFQRRFKYYNWNQIKRSYVRKYNPITEYGGWGLRAGIFGSGKAFNISGNQGLQLEFFNDKKLLIGTKKPDELAKAIRFYSPS